MSFNKTLNPLLSTGLTLEDRKKCSDMTEKMLTAM